MRILCIGDSNTWGYNPTDGSRYAKRWTRVLAELMPGDEIIEEGLNGRTLIAIDDQYTERRGIDSLKMILMSHKPVGLVIIMLGTNDLKCFFGNTASRIGAGIGEYIKVIKNPYNWMGSVMPQLLVIAPMPLGDNIVDRGGFGGEFNEASLAQSKHMAESIEMMCEDFDVPWMDAGAVVKPSTVDEVHLSEEGHGILANSIFDKIREIMK